jgi:WD40 repeat protein
MRSSRNPLLPMLLLLALAPGVWPAEPEKPAPLDALDRGKILPRLKPPRNVPPETLVELGSRDGRWDTIAARPDGKALAVSEPAGAIVIWTLPGFQTMARLNQREVVVLTFSPDGKLLAAGDSRGGLRIWSFNGNTPVNRATLPNVHKDGPMWSLAFAPDGKTLASAGADGAIKLWDLKSGKPVLRSTIRAHEQVVRQLVFAHDGRLLASAGSSDRTAKLWDLAGPEPKQKAVLKCDGPVASVSFAPDGKLLATASYDGKVRVWSLDGEQAAVQQTIEMASKKARLVQFNPDGKSLAVLLLDERGERIAVRALDGRKLCDWEFPHHVQGMTFVDFHHLATANEDSAYILRLPRE